MFMNVVRTIFALVGFVLLVAGAVYGSYPVLIIGGGLMAGCIGLLIHRND